MGVVGLGRIGTHHVQTLLALDGVSVSNPNASQILDISYSAHTPQAAQTGAQAFADAYRSYKEAQALSTIQAYLETIRGQITDLDDRVFMGRQVLAEGGHRWP